MPCMGPDLDYARRHGNEVGRELLAQLMKTHNLWDITDEKMDKKFFHLPGAKTRWNKAKSDFIKAVEDLFVEDAANGF